MDNEVILMQFFKSENSRDWEKYQSYLHPDIEWVLFFSNGQQSFSGIAAYMDKIKAAYRESDITFFCKEMIVSADGNRVVAVLENSHGEISVDIFDFMHGQIIKEYEYLMNGIS